MKHAELIGQILPCPKCGSMVQIIASSASSNLSAADAANAKTVHLPPAESTKPSKSTAAPTTSPTKNAASSRSAATPRPAAAAAASVAESSEELFANAAQMLSDDAPPENPSPPQPQPTAAESSPSETPSAIPVAPKFATYRLIAMIGGGVVVGGLLLALVVRAILLDDAPVAQSETAVATTPVDAAPEPPAEEPAAEAETPNEKVAVETPVEKPATAEATPVEAAMPAEADPAATEEAVASAEPVEMPLDETQPQENPFLFDDPVQAKPSIDAAAVDAPETTDEQRMKFANDPLTGVLGEAFPLFDDSMFDVPASESIVDDTAESVPAVPDSEEQLPPGPIIEKPAPRTVNISARLNDPYLSAKFRKIPLMDHLRNLTRWSTIPISVDPLALQSADVPGDKKIDVNLSGTNTGNLLRAAVEPLRMSVDVTADHIQIVPLKQAGVKPPTIRFPADDLATDEKAMAELAYTLTHLVEPTTWQGAGGTHTCRTGKKELLLSADSKTIFQAMVMVEKLRVARGKSPLSRYDAKLFKLEPRSEQAAAMLDKKVQLSFAEPTELIEIVEQLEDATGTVILIDWGSLLQEGWNPDTKGTMFAIDVTLREALQSLLKPLEMDFRTIDERTLQIAMKSDIAQHGLVELYPISDLADGPTQAAALIHRLKTELGIADDPEFALLYDEPSKHLLVRLPQPKQEELSATLAKMRAP
ncbi:hypothetical protein M4951_09645 [Blastopirellula sp. J2-11]|uniref:hypothetical protein n=1 Tax=Blastopirellula sp. J2-11 TaxID=2943192 RepID=UPI0021C5C547|nr:hypothetical protein [Blastopirellula sp. J2-11]UUO08567.1 hypothetical protein M4951_09645 [Blastopirellula sp. J2-11]